MTQPQRISIIEDSAELQKTLAEALSAAGYEVRAYGRAKSFENELAAFKPDLCLIDLGLPDKDGLGLIRHVSETSNAAILVASGRSTVTDKIAGLELGADDYLAKPFEIPELIARIRALLRRKTPATELQQESALYQFSGWTIDLAGFSVTNTDGHSERLSASEADLLRILLNNPNRLVSRDMLRRELGERSDELSFDRAIDVRVSRLRAKLQDPPRAPKIIKTIYGAGFILIAELDGSPELG